MPITQMTQIPIQGWKTTRRSDSWRGSARVTAAVAVLCAVVLSGCSSPENRDPLDAAIARNDSRHVDTRFEEHPVVLDDTDGVGSLQHFFSASETLIVAEATPEAQLRAASIAVVAHAPMIVYDPAQHQKVSREIDRLNTHTVLTVGDVALAQTTGQVRVHRDPGGLDALSEMMSLRFYEQEVPHPHDAAAAVAHLDPKQPTFLRATWATPTVMPGAEVRPFPIMSRRDADMAPTVVATAESSIASVANARSFGAAVTMIDNPDPRESTEALFAMAGLAEAPLIALGSQFGAPDQLAQRIMQAEEYYLLGEFTALSSAH